MIDFKVLYEDYGMTTKEISEYFEIPYRTVQSWKLGNRKCPIYLLKLMLYKLEKEKRK